MGIISMKALLEAGVHFGHQTRRWNPKMAKYIYTSRNGIHIIDLQKASECIDIAYKAMFDIAEQGGKVLFVGTKKQSQEPIREEAIRAGQYYVDKRWLGGTLTNFKTIKKSIKKLHDLHKMEDDGTFDRLPKKEVIGLRKEMERLEKFLGGIKEMRGVPQALFIIDPRKERNAILEARKLGIPVFGIIDTNCDPDDVDFIIPANDDALRSVRLIVGKMADAVIEANGGLILSEEDEVEVEADESEDLDEEAPVTPKPVKKVEPKPAPAPVKTEEKPVAAKVEVKPTPAPVEVKTAPAKTEKKPTPVKTEVKPVPAPVEVKAAPAKTEEKPAPASVKVKVEPVVEEVKAEPVVEEVKAEPVVKEVKVVQADEVDYDAMTVADLKDLCKELNISGYSKLKKAEIIEEIKKVK